MPLDPSIILQAGHGVTPLIDPMQMGMMGLQAKAAMGQQQLQQMQIKQAGLQNQQLQQTFDDSNRLRQTVASAAEAARVNNTDPLKSISTALQGDGSPSALHLLESITTMGKNMTDWDTAKTGLATKHLAMIGNDIGGTTSPSDAAAAIAYHADNGNIPATQAQELIRSLQGLGTDPGAFKTWKGIQAAKLGASAELIKAITPATHFTGGVAATVDPTTGTILNTQRVKGYSDTPHPGIGPDGKPGFFQIDENGKVPDGWKPIPPAASVQVNAAGNIDPAKFSSRSQQIANGEIPVPKPNRGDPNALKDVADAKQIMIARGEDPINMAGKYEVTKGGQVSFSPGKPNANVINAVNTAADHTNNILVPAMKALNNGDYPAANKILNAIGVQMGNDEKTNFEAVATFLSTEVAKVANGGTAPTLEEIHQARSMFPSSGSNAQIGGAIGIANQIMKGKLTAVEQQHENSFGGKSITDRNLLTPAALSIFGKFGKGGSDAAPGAPSGASPSYQGVKMATTKFNSLSPAARTAFISGGGSVQ